MSPPRRCVWRPLTAAATRVAAVAAFMLLAAPAHAAAVVVLPMALGELGSDADRTRRAVEEALRAALGDAVVFDREATPACSAEARCVAQALARHGATEALAVRAARGTTATVFATVDFTVLDADGAVRARATRALRTAAAPGDLRSLVFEVFLPRRFVARLDVEGLRPGDVLLVDGLAARAPLRLRPGPHHVAVRRDAVEHAATTVDLALDETVRWRVPDARVAAGDGGAVAVAVAAAPTAAAPTARNGGDNGTWLPVVTGAVVAVGLGLALAPALLPRGTAEQEAVLRTDGFVAAGNDPTGQGFAYGPDGRLSSHAVLLDRIAAVDGARTALVPLQVAGGLLAVAATLPLVLDWLGAPAGADANDANDDDDNNDDNQADNDHPRGPGAASTSP